MKRGLSGFFAGIGVTVLVLATLAATKGDDYDKGKNLEVFFNIFRDVSIMYVDPVDPEKMINSAANAMLAELDPYTEYMPKEDYAEFAVSTSGKYGGMGALIRKAKENQYGEVSEVFEGFPAYKAGLVSGDTLLSIDGVDLKNLKSQQVSELLKGDPGSSFTLKIKSLLTEEEKVVVIKRELVKIDAVPYYSIIDKESGVGYILLNTFSEDSGKEVEDAVKAMSKNGELKSLILDLRDNGGGILDEAVKIVSLFVDKGTEVVSMKGRLYPQPRIYKTKSEPIAKDLPLMVLVNGNSASASEIVSGALQDLDRAVIMGSQTFGKGLVQTTREVGYGGVMKVTTAKYYIPSGRCIQAVDFSHRNEDGSVGNIPDSLKQEFKTAGDRSVYDGGGISPDIEGAQKKWTKFTSYVVRTGYSDDFAKMYYKKNRTSPDISTFSLTDQDLDEFVEFLKQREFNIKSSTEYYLEKLKESAAIDRYNSKLDENISNIEEALELDIAYEVSINRDDIKTALESSIMTIYYYQKGKAEIFVNNDPDIKNAIEQIQTYKIL